MEKYAIGLILDKSNQLEKLREYLSQFGIDLKNNYFHITLAGFECDDENYLIEKIKEFANENSSFKIKFSHLGTFLTEDNVIFLAPYHSKKLFNYHRNLKHKVCANKNIILCDYYKAIIWNPHCTLAYKIPHEKYMNILDNLSSVVEFPFEATISKIDIYEYSNRNEKIFEIDLPKKITKKDSK